MKIALAVPPTPWRRSVRRDPGRLLRRGARKIAVDGEAEPVVVKLGVWVSNTKTRRDKLSQEQRVALAKLGVDWA
ncbi:hypothetical protein ACWGHA_36570 [Streptomyces xanthophaeus]